MNSRTFTRRWAEIASALYCHDAITIFFLGLLSLLAVAAAGHFAYWAALVLQNVLITSVILVVAVADHRIENSLLDGLHRFYIAVMIYIIFKEVYVMLPALHPVLIDNDLIAIDRAVFGVNPTQWLERLISPYAVEYFQICYSLFYFIMLGLAVEMVARQDERNYEHVVTYIAYGFFLSYIGYLLFPAVGPRFTLHEFSRVNADLPGLWLTDLLRTLINQGESIPAGARNVVAYAQRDAFPSGHTQMTLISITLAWRYRAVIRWWVTVIGVSLIFATVYLRYHYVVDIFGGVVFYLLTIWTAPYIERWWSRVVAHARNITHFG